MHLPSRQLFLQHMAQTSPEPMGLEIAHAEGNYLIGSDGKNYLDLIAGISVSSLGHGHPEVVKAVQEQAAKHMHIMVYGETIQSPQVELAAFLTAQLPSSLQSVYLVNSGTEAVEGAMKLAKKVTGKNKFLAHTKAYHGSTQGALGLMDNEYFTAAFRPLLPGIQFIEQNNIQAVAGLDKDFAAVIVEPVQAEKGAIPCDKNYLLALRKFCDETGALLIFDEIQTGMGRCGSLFAFEHYGVVPDVLLLGKAFGGGMPLACFISSVERMHSLADNPVLGHITTFGGHPVCCAAALAALKVTVQQRDQFRVEQKSTLFSSLLVHPKIRLVTGLGLLLGVHMDSADTVQKSIKKCLEKGVFTDWFLHAPDCLRIAPPLGIQEDEIRFACRVILDSLD